MLSFTKQIFFTLFPRSFVNYVKIRNLTDRNSAEGFLLDVNISSFVTRPFRAYWLIQLTTTVSVIYNLLFFHGRLICLTSTLHLRRSGLQAVNLKPKAYLGIIAETRKLYMRVSLKTFLKVIVMQNCTVISDDFKCQLISA